MEEVKCVYIPQHYIQRVGSFQATADATLPHHSTNGSGNTPRKTPPTWKTPRLPRVIKLPSSNQFTTSAKLSQGSELV
eukprot:scaffold1190_cov187-Ochromonas_danica.AAC.15